MLNWPRQQACQKAGSRNGKKRSLGVPFNDEQVLQGLSRAPHHPLPRLDPQVVDRVLEIRDDPPEGLGRTPGPKAILSDLNRDDALKEEGLRLPRSTRTIHRILHENGRIASRLPRLTDPLERASADGALATGCARTPPLFRLIRTGANMWWKL